MCSFSRLKTLRSMLNQINCCGVNENSIRSISVKPKNDPIEYCAFPSDPKTKRLYVWGYAATGALGELKVHGKSNKFEFAGRPIRKNFQYSYNLEDVACGLGFSLYAVDRPGGVTIFGSGLNTDGQIGFHARRGPDHPLRIIYSVVPIRTGLQLSKSEKIVKVAAGRAHSLALTNTGLILSFGNNSFGQCARHIVQDEDYCKYKLLWKVKFDPEEHVVDIKCGQDHSLFLTASGKVYSCGNGSDGQTGLGHYNVTAKPTLVEGDIKGEKIVKLSSTTDTVLALSDKGEAFGWGNSEYFQVPLAEYTQQVNTPRHLPRLEKLGKIKDIASAGTVSMVLTENKDLFVWGFGILGKGPEMTESEEPSQIPNTLFGQNAYNPDITVESLACGMTSLAAITNKGDLYMWGRNQFGQLGLGHKFNQFYPLNVSLGAKVFRVYCGVDHTMAICYPF